MAIYLVRWPDLSASLVRARDEDDLIDILDQVANPEGCEWAVHDGPLFIDVRLPAQWRIEDERPGEPVTPAQVVAGDIGRMATEPVIDAMELSLAGEDGCETGMAILRTAFPRLHAVIEKLQERDDELASEGVVPEAALARQMDAPLALVRRYAELARDRQATSEEDKPTVGGDDHEAAESLPTATATTRRAPLFAVANHHTAACGEPLAVDGDAPGTYVGYFANEYGEQAIYAYDHGTGEATLRMGDAGWHDARRVVAGQAEGLALTRSEAMWLRACWLATGGLKDRPTPGTQGGTRRG